MSNESHDGQAGSLTAPTSAGDMMETGSIHELPIVFRHIAAMPDVHETPAA